MHVFLTKNTTTKSNQLIELHILRYALREASFKISFRIEILSNLCVNILQMNDFIQNAAHSSKIHDLMETIARFLECSLLNRTNRQKRGVARDSVTVNGIIVYISSNDDFSSSRLIRSLKIVASLLYRVFVV